MLVPTLPIPARWLMGILLLLVLLFVVLVIRFVQIYREIQHNRSHMSNDGLLSTTQSSRTTPCKTMVVLGSGGHTSEMLLMVQQLDASLFQPLVFVVAATDHTSVQRLEATLPPPTTNREKKSGNNNSKHTIYTIPRSREVGQSYLSSCFTTLYAMVHANVLVFRQRPELLLCNGPGTCVPLVVGAWGLRILGRPCKFVFVESYCRVQTLSLTGRLLYPFVDGFLVHWDSLQTKYPLTYRLSTFVMDNGNTTANTVNDTPSNNKQKKKQ